MTSAKSTPTLLMLKYVIILVLAAIFLLPLVWMIALSLKSFGEFYDYPPTFFTDAPQWNNFFQVLDEFHLGRYLLNSVIVSAAIAGGQIITASTAGFAFATLHFTGKRILFLVFLSSMMVPGAVILIPLFLIAQRLGMVDTYAGLIIPFVFTGYGIFLMRQFFLGIPRDLFDAAIVDGASFYRVYANIYMPLAKPAIATLFTLAFVFFWNTLLWPVVIINSDSLKTIPVGVAGLVGFNNSFPHLVMAGATLMILPALALFLILQRYFMRGFIMSGIKG